MECVEKLPLLACGFNGCAVKSPADNTTYSNNNGKLKLWCAKSRMKECGIFFWGELIDKYKDINANSKTVFTDYAMLKLVLYSPHMFLLFCHSKVGVVKFFLRLRKLGPSWYLLP